MVALHPEPEIDTHLKQNRVVPIEQLHPHPDNYREHPELQVERLVASLKRFGQGRSIVAQDGPEGYLIVAGHGIYLAAQKLKMPSLRADILPADWTPEQIRGYLIADNQHGEQAIDDQDILARLLKEQLEYGFDLLTLGTDEAAVHDLFTSLTPPTLDDLTEEYGDEPEEESLWPVIRVKVSPETKETYESLMEDAEGEREGDRFAWLLERVNLAAEVGE